MSEAGDAYDDGQGEELFEHHRLVADPGQAPLRVDKFIINRVAHLSRNKLQSAAKSGYVRVNGEPVKSNHKVKPEDVVTVELPQPVYEFELLPEPMDLDVVHEDDQVLVINKPMNLVVHPGHGNYSGTLVNGVLYHFQSLPSLPDSPEPRPGLVHRLDKDTTGLMVLGKTERALTELSEQFFERTVNRRYWALVWGDVAEDGTVTGHVGRSLRDRRVQQVFVDGREGKHAVTHYRVLERLGPSPMRSCATCLKPCPDKPCMPRHWASPTLALASGWIFSRTCLRTCRRSSRNGRPTSTRLPSEACRVLPRPFPTS